MTDTDLATRYERYYESFGNIACVKLKGLLYKIVGNVVEKDY